jgi:hypothetical protein
MGVFMLRLGVAALARGGLPARPPFAQVVAVAGDDDRTVLDPGGPLRPVADIVDWVTVGVFPADSIIKLNHAVFELPERLGAYGPERPDELPANVAVVDYAYAVDPLKQVPPEAWRGRGLERRGAPVLPQRPARPRRPGAGVPGRGAGRGARPPARRGDDRPHCRHQPGAGRLYPVGERVA